MSSQVIELHRCPTPSALRRNQLRRRLEWISFLVEALVTVGIMVSFVLCAIVFLCIV